MKALISFIIIGLSTFASFRIYQIKYSHQRAVLNVSLENDIDSMDPAKAFNDESLKLIGQVYETLYQYHYLKRPYEVIPLLADGMPKISKNGLNYTIKIKQGIQYHPHPAFKGKSRFVTSYDFVNQIKRLAFEPIKSTGSWLFKNRLIGFEEYSREVGNNFEKMLNTKLKGVETPDSTTLILKFRRKETIILNFLTMNFIVPIPQEVIEFEENNLDNKMIGTGPYFLDKIEKNKFFLIRYPQYRKDFYPSAGDRYANLKDLVSSSNEPIPFVDEIVFKVIEDSADRMRKFIEEELDFINIPKEFVDKFIISFGKLPPEYQEKGVQLKHFTSVSSDWISFNMRDPIWGRNKNLRWAVAYAIDYAKYVSLITNGANLRANSLYNPGIPGYDPRKKLPFHYDLEKAREYMRKAGYPEGQGLGEVTYSTRSDSGVHLLVGDFLKEQLGEIGIKVKVEVLKFSEFLRKGRAGELQLFLDRWIYDYPDAENLIQLLTTKNHPGINKSGYSNKEIDKLYEFYITTSNEEAKVKTMEKIEEIIHRDMPWIMLTYYSSYILHHSNIKNYRKSSFIRNHLKYIKKVE